AGGRELAAASKVSQLFQNGVASLRGSVGDDVRCKHLAGERRRVQRKRLRLRRHLTVHIRCGHLPIFDGEEWPSGLPLEDEDKTRLGDLGHRIDRSSISLYGYKGRGRRKIAVQQ